MHPPPPAGRTGRAPPGFDGDGGAGVTIDGAVDPAAAPAGDHPPAKTSNAVPPHSAVAALVFRFLTITNCSFPSSDPQ